MIKITSLAAVALLAPLSAWSQAAPAAAPDDDTDWSVDVPTKTPTGGVSAPSTPEGGFSHSDRIVFGEKMREHVLDQICRNAQIPLGYSHSFEGVGAAGADITRRLRVMPDNHVAIEDSEKVSLDVGRTLVTKEVGSANFGLWIGGHFDGTSMVVRPMPTTESCDEIWRLLKLNDAKTIFPFKAERLTAMGVGELWKLPATLSIGHSESLGHAIADASGVTGSVVLSFGTGQTGAAMMTVYRMSEDKMRFRFRISHARIHNASGGVSAVYPAIHVFAAPANILIKFVDSQLTREISHFLVENVGAAWTSSDGQQLMMEFILDPKKPEDMEELAKVLRGDFVELLKMAQRMVNLQASAARAQKDFRDLEAKQEGAFKRPANFPGLDIYHATSKSLHLMLPFLFDHQRVSNLADDRIVRLDPEGGEVHIYRSDKNKNSGQIDFPVAGFYVKHNVAMSAQSFVFKDKDGKTTDPQAVYIQQEGFLRHDSEDVRAMAKDVNDIIALTGAKGGAPNPRLALPIDKLLPPEPAIVTKNAPHGQETKQYPTYHDAGLAFTMVFTAKAVDAIIHAADELIVKCYANTLGDQWDKQALGWMADNGMIKPGGKVDFDREALKAKFNYDDNGVNWLRGLADTAGKIVRDMDKVRQAPTPEARAKALVDLMSGRGKSDLAYNDMMRVLVQLVDPLDVTADLVINVNKSIKGKADLHAHMMVKKNRPDNPGLKSAGDAKNRFAQPSELVD